MAVVYVADVDLASFDFAMVVAGHEAATGTVEERQAYRSAKYQSWKQKPREELLAICNQYKLPYPRDNTAAVKVMTCSPAWSRSGIQRNSPRLGTNSAPSAM